MGTWYNLATSYCMISCVLLPLLTPMRNATKCFDFLRDSLMMVCLAFWGTYQYKIMEKAPDLPFEVAVYDQIDGILALVTIAVAAYGSYLLNSPTKPFLKKF